LKFENVNAISLSLDNVLLLRHLVFYTSIASLVHVIGNVVYYDIVLVNSDSFTNYSGLI
jgi:hypothetical protein